MTELEHLEQRRELVVLAAELQRANIARRLERIQANPAKRVLGLAANAVRRPLLLKLGSAALTFAVRTYRKKRSTRKKH
jgi:hypothetical protein